MDHRAIQDQLFAFYDGELTGAARHVVDDHLADCADCRALVAYWTQVARACFPPPAVSPSEAFVQRVMARLPVPALVTVGPGPAPRPHPVRFSRWLLEGRWLAPAFGLAALLLVLARGPIPHAVSVESLLLSDRQEPAALQQVLTDERSSPDDVLGLLMEDT